MLTVSLAPAVDGPQLFFQPPPKPDHFWELSFTVMTDAAKHITDLACQSKLPAQQTVTKLMQNSTLTELQPFHRLRPDFC